MTDDWQEKKQSLDRAILLAKIKQLRQWMQEMDIQSEREKQLKDFEREFSFGEPEDTRAIEMAISLEEMEQELQAREDERRQEEGRTNGPLEKMGKALSGEMGR